MSVIRWKTDVIGNFYTTAGWAGDTGPSTVPDVNPFDDGAGFGNAASAGGVAMTKSPELTTLVGFDITDGASPLASLTADAAGDLFGTTYLGGANGDGTVFEIARTRHGYADTPTTLVSLAGADGAYPTGGLIADAAGDLFGTTDQGGADDFGTVFEIVKTKGGYAGAPTTLVSFTGDDGKYPLDSLIADAAGDLFGTTSQGGVYGDGTVFEILKTKSGYAGKPVTLASFTGADGEAPGGSLVADAAGNLFGTADIGGGKNESGAVFEIAKTNSGYAAKPTVLVKFNGADGKGPMAALIVDASGDLFGTTEFGGTYNDGTVFEIVKTKDGYASAPTTLVSFNGSDGESPYAALIEDAAGDLFGTTESDGVNGYGTVFEVAKTNGGYATTPTTLVNFTSDNGENPNSSLIADAAGNLFGTTEGGGPNENGTVFEITHSGFVPPARSVVHAQADINHSSRLGATFVQAMASHGATRLGATGATILASRNESPTFLSRPQAA